MPRPLRAVTVDTADTEKLPLPAMAAVMGKGMARPVKASTQVGLLEAV